MEALQYVHLQKAIQKFTLLAQFLTLCVFQATGYNHDKVDNPPDVTTPCCKYLKNTDRGITKIKSVHAPETKEETQ
tara:strand:+ start:1116 stop:1343 length:228 start_codon:yes stop_codon:yes gene_type:complete